KGVHPRVIAHYEPWMALSFSEGSIGGDIERVSTEGLAEYYAKTQVQKTVDASDLFPEPKGSNGIAIGPKDSASGHALL
ncbi:hypothetical protein ACXYUI_32490, partial [Klebsiella pneumoniae]